jgi:hypothetical protein
VVVVGAVDVEVVSESVVEVTTVEVVVLVESVGPVVSPATGSGLLLTK